MEFINTINYFTLTEIRVFLVILIFSLLAFQLFKTLNKKPYNMPPGPIGIPIFGYLPFLDPMHHLTLCKLSKKYGGVFSFYLGQTLTVVCNDWSSAEEALSKTETLDRPEGIFDALPNGFGFAGHNGKIWQEGRRLTFKSLRNIGLGKQEMDKVMEEEIEDIIKELHQNKEQTIDVRKVLNSTFTNNILTLLFGERLPSNHPTTLYVSHMVDIVSESFLLLTIANFLPTLCGVLTFLGLSGSKDKIKKVIKFDHFIEKYVNMELEKHNNNEDVFIQMYLKEMKSYPLIKKDSIYGNVQLNLFAGAETSRTSTVWLLLAVTKFPDVQKKIQKELDSVLGKDGKIRWSERDKVPYTYAAILESLRWKTVVPVNTLRKTNADIKIQGYDVPKGTIIAVNQWAIHNDPKYWPEPETFDPQRFLTKDGKIINSPKSYMPFSIGRRNCPGKNIALNEIFRYFISIVRNFHVLPPEGGVKYDTLFGITYQATNMNLRLVPREGTTT